MGVPGKEGAGYVRIPGIGLQGRVRLVAVEPLKITASGTGQQRFGNGGCGEPGHARF
jgi:hypothetical protein